MSFYTYLWLREDGSPYYVGKGQGNRAFRKGSPPEHRIVIQEHDSEEEAFEAECFLIDLYGRVDLGTGCLRNLTDGGENPPSAAGKRRTLETRRKLSEAAKRQWEGYSREKRTEIGRKSCEPYWTTLVAERVRLKEARDRRDNRNTQH